LLDSLLQEMAFTMSGITTILSLSYL